MKRSAFVASDDTHIGTTTSNVVPWRIDLSPDRKRRGRSAEWIRNSTCASSQMDEPGMFRMLAATGSHVSRPLVTSRDQKPSPALIVLISHRDHTPNAARCESPAQAEIRDNIRFPQCVRHGKP